MDHKGTHTGSKSHNRIEGAQHKDYRENYDKGTGTFRIELHREGRTGGKPKVGMNPYKGYGKGGG
jgi:hypothetical protein